MTNYKETTLSGSKWERVYKIEIDAPKDEQAVLRFGVQEVTNTDGVLSFKNSRSVQANFVPGETVPVLNPLNDEETGATISSEEVYAIVHSYVMFKMYQNDDQQEQLDHHLELGRGIEEPEE